LAFMVGVPVLGTEVRLDRGLLHRPLSDRIDTPSRDQLVSHTLAYRPDVNAAISQRDSASAAAALNRRQLFPSISLSAQYSQEGTGQDAIQPPTVIVGASLPLPLFYQYQGEIDKADAAVRAQTIDLHRIEAQVIADIDSSLANLAAAQSRVQRMESRLLDRAARTQELVQVQYEKGAASLLELLDAQRTFIGTRADYLQDLANYWGAVFALEAATGMELIK